MITDSEDRSMIAELEQIIQDEEAKPEAERDADLIDNCIREIAELKGVRSDYSDEEIDKITDKLVKAAEKEKKQKRFIRLAAGIAAAFVIVSGVTACAIHPALINWLAKIVRMPFGTVIQQENVTYVYQGVSTDFENVYDFVVTEHLDIYYPDVLPRHARITIIEKVICEEKEYLIFGFSDEKLHFSIQFKNKVKKEEPIISQIKTGELLFDVYKAENALIAICQDKDIRYIIQAETLDDIIIITSGMRKG